MHSITIKDPALTELIKGLSGPPVPPAANRRAAMLNRIEQHGRHLLTIFPNATERDPVKLCKRLRRLEAQGAALALENCNVGIEDAEYFERQARILSRVHALLNYNAQEVPVFVNGDPRGYALKIDDAWMRAHPEYTLHRDWGGYGILAPDLR